MIRGLVLLGTGRADGFGFFDASRDAFLAALSPPIAFLLVLAALLLLQRPSLAAVCLLLVMFCALLLPPVLSHLMARLWKRTDRWPRYATASTWSVWLMLPAYLPAMLLASVLIQLGVGREWAAELMLLLLGIYFLWLQWFMAWKGLGINRIQAFLTVTVLTAGSVLLAAALQPLLVEVVIKPALSGAMPAAKGSASP